MMQELCQTNTTRDWYVNGVMLGAVGVLSVITVLLTFKLLNVSEQKIGNLTEQVEAVQIENAQLKKDLGMVVGVIKQMKEFDAQLVKKTDTQATNFRILGIAVKDLFGRKWDNWLEDFNEKIAKEQKTSTK